VIVDHDSGRLVWAAPGRDDATLHRFFDDLGPRRASALTHVSADMAGWIARVVAKRAPGAVRCADAFHVVAGAAEALDIERRRAWNRASGAQPANTTIRRRPRTGGDARALKRARFALWKNPEELPDRRHQHHQLEWIAQTDPPLWRAYLLKEGLRYVFAVKGQEGKVALDRWIGWARRSRLPAFVDLQRRVCANRAAIDATLDCGLSNARVESTNTKIRLLTRVASDSTDPNPSSPSPS
jgi:transposase